MDLKKGLACRGHCEAEAQALIQLVERTMQVSGRSANLIKSSRGVRAGTAVFQFVLGAVFVAWGLSEPERLKFLIVVGAGFIAYGGYWLFLARSLGKDKTP